MRLRVSGRAHVIVEVKGKDDLAEVKKAAALRWVAAVNAEGSHGHWQYVLVREPSEIEAALSLALAEAQRQPAR